jgi:DNA-binding NtrC family response regulator
LLLPSDAGGEEMEQTQLSEKNERIGCDEIIARKVEKSRHQKSKANILVVDDEPCVAQTVRDLLAFAGYDVKTAESGKQAIKLLKSPDRFDLMITDMKMPEMDGLELLRLSHQLRKTLPVVILTGWGTVDNGIHALEEGAYDYVLKPFNTEKLLLVVWEALKNSPSGVWAA